jgi:hypothetical protein
MADSATIVLNTGADRDKAIRWCSQIRDGTRVTFKAPRRSLDQNANMWSMLTDISRQVKWHGYDLSPDDYKCLFTAGLRKAFVVPDLENTSFVMLGLRTSDMSVEEMSNMIELMFKFGAEHNVTWTDPNA